MRLPNQKTVAFEGLSIASRRDTRIHCGSFWHRLDRAKNQVSAQSQATRGEQTP